jgi:hypothetical protein
MTTFSDLHSDSLDVITYDFPGNAWYVDSGAAGGADSAGYGTTPAAPFLTLDYAVGACTASNGDVIYLCPGHAETKAAAGSLFAADVAGITIIGLGKGAARPTFTLSDTAAVCTISAASVHLENVLFVAGIDSVVAPLTISAADVTLKDVEMRDTTDVEFVAGVITTAAADRLTIDGFFYNGYTGGNACTIGLKLVGVNTGTIKNSKFIGVFSTGAIQFVTTASTGVLIENCTFLNTGTAVSKDIVSSVAACTWRAVNCYDMVAGYSVEGSDVRALRYVGGPICTTYQSTSPLPNNTAAAAFNFIGAIEILELYAIVTTEIQGQATAFKMQVAPSTQAAATDLCAALDINAFDVGSVVRATLDYSDAALGADDVASAEGEAYAVKSAVAYGAALTSAINIHSAAASTGAVLVVCKWLPNTVGAYLKSA